MLLCTVFVAWPTTLQVEFLALNPVKIQIHSLKCESDSTLPKQHTLSPVLLLPSLNSSALAAPTYLCRPQVTLNPMEIRTFVAAYSSPYPLPTPPEAPQ